MVMYPAVAMRPPVPEHPSGGAVFALGLISLVIAGITGPFAWAMGSKARKEIAANPTAYRESGLLTAGWVMGIIGTIFLIVNVVIVLVYFVIYLLIIVALFGASTY